MDCPKCGYAMTDFDVDCPRCKRMAAEQKKTGTDAPPTPPVPTPVEIGPRAYGSGPLPAIKDGKTRHPSLQGAPRIGAAVVVGLVLFGILFLGKYHVLQSSEGSIIIPKVHFSFSETFVSLETITTIPYVKARAEHPLAVRALQREGLIETEEEMDARVQREVDEKMQQAEAETQRRMDEAQRDIDARMDAERRRIESQFPSSYP